MAKYTAVVRDDGTVQIPGTVARPGRTVVITVSNATPRVANDDPGAKPVLDRLTARTPEQKRALMDEVLNMGRAARERLPEEQRTSNHDWLYDDHGLPK